MVELVYVISKLMHNLLALVGKFTFGSCWLFFKVKVLFAFEILFLEKIDNFSTEQESGPILRCMCLTFNSSSIINLHITNLNQDSIHMCTRKVPLKWMTIVHTFMMNESYLPENVWLFLRRIFIASWLFLHPLHISQEYLWTLERNIDDDTVMSLSSLTMTVPGPGPGVSRSHHQQIFILKNIFQTRVTSMSVPTVSLSRAGPQGSPRHSVDRWAVSSEGD